MMMMTHIRTTVKSVWHIQFVSISKMLRETFHLFFIIFSVMLTSIPFLLMTFLIYSFIKELRNIHGKCLMCCISGLICFYLSQVMIQLNHETIFNSEWLCKSSGYVAYISILICFFWLNVICFDIWSTFR
jgi:hypothetical protein